MLAGQCSRMSPEGSRRTNRPPARPLPRSGLRAEPTYRPQGVVRVVCGVIVGAAVASVAVASPAPTRGRIVVTPRSPVVGVQARIEYRARPSSLPARRRLILTLTPETGTAFRLRMTRVVAAPGVARSHSRTSIAGTFKGLRGVAAARPRLTRPGGASSVAVKRRSSTSLQTDGLAVR